MTPWDPRWGRALALRARLHMALYDTPGRHLGSWCCPGHPLHVMACAAWLTRGEDEERCEFTYGRQARAPFNLTDSPAVAVPTGFASTGLPLSMQIIGKPFDEATVYRVAQAYEQATTWDVKPG